MHACNKCIKMHTKLQNAHKCNSDINISFFGNYIFPHEHLTEGVLNPLKKSDFISRYIYIYI